MRSNLNFEYKIENIDIEAVKKLYLEAFPKDERKPFSIIYKKAVEKEIDILEFKDKNFVGMAIVMKYQDIALVDYFAISKSIRSKGYGSMALDIIKDFYKDKRLVLEIEELVQTADNYSQRLARKDFYVKNGFQMMDLKVYLFGVCLEFMYTKEKISFEEYLKMYETIFGKDILKNIKN